jgi:predicted nucleotidyltransferase
MRSATDILFGKTRQAVLARLYDVPVGKYYLRELSRQTGISTGALQKELKTLLGADLIVSENDGNRVSYSANTSHPIYHELVALVRKTCGVRHMIKYALAPLEEHIKLAAIYGSTAKHTDHASSDIDLLVVGDLSLAMVLDVLHPLEGVFAREISLRLYSPEEFRQKLNEQQGFITGVINGPLDLLIGKLNDA